MSENLNDTFSNDSSETDEQIEGKPPPKSLKSNNLYKTLCNVRRCHPSQKKLTQSEIDIIKRKAKLNKNLKP